MKKTWTIDRMFSYDIPDTEIKKSFKTLKEFQKQMNESTDKCINFLNKYFPETVEDDELEPTFTIKKSS